MLYRVLRRLTTRDNKTIEPNTVSDLSQVSPHSIQILLGQGSVSEVHAPPVRVIAELETLADRLEEAGYGDLSALLAAKDTDLVCCFGSDTAVVLKRIAIKELEVQNGSGIYG
jgi:hypothetical protein